MSTSAEGRQAIIAAYATKPGDTGSPEVQIALISDRITYLTEHLKIHAKDFHSRRGLLVLVGQRRGLLDYVKRKDRTRYETLLKRLNLRR
jgi:small subunit ribosomal protein S15